MHWLLQGRRNAFLDAWRSRAAAVVAAIMWAARRRGPVLPGIEEAWLARQVLDPETFAALTDEQKAKAFSIKGEAWQGLLEDVHRSIFEAIANGTPQGEWAKDVWPKIAEKWGASGPAIAARMDTIFRTNVQAAYAGGRYAAMFRPDMVELAPYVRYRAILDTRTRDSHRALNGKVFRKNDPYGRRFYAPLGFGCRCLMEELTEEDLRAGGWKVTEGHTLYADPAIGPPPKGWDTDRVATLVDESLKARFFGPPDPEVTERIIRAYEEDLRKVKGREEAIVFDLYGLVRWRGKGQAGNRWVAIPTDRGTVGGSIVSHNHMSGLSLSAPRFKPEVGDWANADAGFAWTWGLGEIRAVGTLANGQEVTYRLIAPSGGWKVACPTLSDVRMNATAARAEVRGTAWYSTASHAAELGLLTQREFDQEFTHRVMEALARRMGAVYERATV